MPVTSEARNINHRLGEIDKNHNNLSQVPREEVNVETVTRRFASNTLESATNRIHDAQNINREMINSNDHRKSTNETYLDLIQEPSGVNLSIMANALLIFIYCKLNSVQVIN